MNLPAPSNMKIQSKKPFLLGSAIVVGVATVLYLMISRDKDASIPLPMAVIGSPASAEKLSPEEQIKRRELVKQMIQNGDFSPPPGNAAAISSSISPFGQGARTTGDGASRNVSDPVAARPGALQITPMNLGTQAAQTPVGITAQAKASATSSVQTSTVAGNNVFVTPPVQTDTGTKSTQIEFEPPPGIGSPKGGQ